jgi:hypothetical protein
MSRWSLRRWDKTALVTQIVLNQLHQLLAQPIISWCEPHTKGDSKALRHQLFKPAAGLSVGASRRQETNQQGKSSHYNLRYAPTLLIPKPNPHHLSGWREKQETHHIPAHRNVRLKMLLVRCPPQSTNATSMRPWAGCRARFSSIDWSSAHDRSRTLAAQRSDPKINTVSLTEARKPSSEDHVNPLHAPSKAAHKQAEVPSVVTTGLWLPASIPRNPEPLPCAL